MRSKLPIALVVLLVAGQASAIPVASAQEEQGAVQLRLVRHPIWHDTDDAINLRLRIDNTSTEPL